MTTTTWLVSALLGWYVWNPCSQKSNRRWKNTYYICWKWLKYESE